MDLCSEVAIVGFETSQFRCKGGKIMVVCGLTYRFFVGKRPSAAGRRVRRIRRRRNRELLGGGGEEEERRNPGGVFLNNDAVVGASAGARTGSTEGESGRRSHTRCERRRISPLASVVARHGNTWRATGTRIDKTNLKM